MYEEFTMDKKPNRSNPSQGKCLASDNKKSQDATKPFPKSSRSGWERPANFNSKNEQQNRRPLPQKNKALDKRPRPRGQDQSSGKQDSEVAELGSVFKPGSKKQTRTSYTHLLQYELPPRDRPSSSHTFLGKGSYKPINKKTKEQFLQANYQFVVKSGSDLRSYECDPDRLVQWDIVEQIRIPSRDELGCPICLSAAIAGQVTRCGHVYCWSCILHYLSLCDNNSGPCPICFEHIKGSELRGVVRVPIVSAPSKGDIIEFNLMRRDKTSLTPIPFNSCNQVGSPKSKKLWPNISDPPGAIKYSKILLATPEQVLKLHEQLQIDLKKQLEEEKGSSEICFIERALYLLNEKEAIQQSVIVQNENEIKSSDEELDFSSKYLRELDLNEEKSSEKPYFFYQAAGGEFIFLHNLSVAMLMNTHVSYNQSPLQFEAKCIERESLSVTPEFRKRHKNLGHLPIGCQLELVVVDLKPPLISIATQLEFESSLKQRSLRKRRKQQEEQRRFDKNEQRNLWSAPMPPLIESSIEFPQWGFDPWELPPLPKGPEIQASTSSSDPEILMDTERKRGEDRPAPAPAGPSFAQMLRQGHGFSKQVKSEIEHFQEQVPDDSASRFPTMNDALMIAIERQRDDGSANGGKKNKKKKGKQKLIFTTRMAFNDNNNNS